MHDVLLATVIFAAATLYSSVGHAGASGYLAAMALFSVPPAAMKPAALTLNILVASITTIRFHRAGCSSWRVLWPFALGALPFAFFGGSWNLAAGVYKPIVGAILLFAAVRLAIAARRREETPTAMPHPGIAIAVGGAIGLLAGLTGTGGGIFLSPVLLLMRWAKARETAGVSAAFILVVSIAGLAGNLTGENPVSALPPQLPYWAVAAGAGGLLGSHIGSRRLAPPSLRRVLAAVLIVAGLKLIFT
ncbi:MAG: sulfite exporter TauE/SafE family protein [Phycisphaerae bacterium]